jgi:hypothetical protein
MSRLKRSLAFTSSSSSNNNNNKRSSSSSASSGANSTTNSSKNPTDIPEDPPLPYLLLPCLQPCSMVRAGAAHAVAQLVSRAPLQKWLGGRTTNEKGKNVTSVSPLHIYICVKICAGF